MTSALRIGIISDTHGLVRNGVYAAFEGVDEIVHAGDVGDPSVLTELEVLAPVHAVYGNVDGWELRGRLPESLELERLGHKVAVVHGHQWGAPRPGELVGRFPGCSVLVFGHTHQPLIERVGDALVVNPGSAGPRRFRRPVSAALLELRRGRRPMARLVDLSR